MQTLPQLLVDLRVVRSNFIQLRDKLNVLSIDLRPHVKTIHDPQIAMPLFNEGLKKICVSNIQMLADFLTAGWRDICLALPVPLTGLKRLDALLDDYDNAMITLYVDHDDQLNVLKQLKRSYCINIEVDTGQFRSGVSWKRVDQIIAMIQCIKSSSHQFTGLTTHFGYLYGYQSKGDIVAESGNAMMRILNLKEQMEAHFSEAVPLAIGDTPSSLAMSHFDCVSEIRSGNFLFNDLTIYKKGLCERKDLACVLKAVVISKFDDDSRFVLHCGSVHLSKEKHSNPDIQYGLVSLFNDGEIENPLARTMIIALYQEHAVVASTPDVMHRISVGQTVGVFPVHSCLAMDAMVHKNRVQLIEV